MNEFTERVLSLLSERLECDPKAIALDAQLSELVIDSLDLVEIVMILEDEFPNLSVRAVRQNIVTVRDFIESMKP